MLFKQTYKVIFIDFDPFYDNEYDNDENNDNVNHEYANDGIYGDVDVFIDRQKHDYSFG